MSTKVLLQTMLLFGLLVVVFLAVQIVSSKNVLFPTGGEAAIVRSLAGSDWIERHASNYYTGSDWIERHPQVVTKANDYRGSDWIERHPPVIISAGYSAGSDWVDRHPSYYYTGSDWIERH